MLTSVGLEVEGIERAGGMDITFSKVVIGQVKSASQHPNADRLRVCEVDAGGSELLTIVCGAPNVAAGQKVAVALEGAVLYPTGSTEALKIKRGKIRGAESQGMICAEDELGIGTNHDGIMVLAEDAPIGTDFAAYLLQDADYRLEIGLTPNRIDAASHIGIARELSALWNKPYKRPQGYDFSQTQRENPISISVQDTDRCKRYGGVYIAGVEVKESPEWLKERVLAVGLRPINNIVDITNFVMMEYGQPLHAFDADTIKGKQIIVKTLNEDSKFVTLDEKERTIRGRQDLMICDAENPLVIAGVFGGLHAGVSLETKNIFLESAYFDATSVRKTAKHHGLSTDSSFRYERGTDPNIIPTAAARATQLILEIAGGAPSMFSETYSQHFPHFEVALSVSKTQRLIGKEIPCAEIIAILQRLEMVVSERDEDTLIVQVPPYRVDVQQDQDVMEELLRIYGFDKVPTSGKITFTPNHQAKTSAYGFVKKVSQLLSAGGLYEMWNNSLVSKKYASEKAVEIYNPLSEELAVMREHLLHSGLEVIQYNQNRQSEDLMLYEWGKVYSQKTNDEGKKKYGEKLQLAIFLTGAKTAKHWSGKAENVSLFTMTKEVERLAKALGFKGELRETAHELLDYGLEYVVKKQVVFTYGKVKQAIQEDFDLRNEVFYLVGDGAAMQKLHTEQSIVYQPIPLYPGIRRDISMLIPETESYENIRKKVLQINPLIKSVELHDVYKGKNIAEDQKSYLISLFLQDSQRTLEDSVADKIWEKVCGMLEHTAGAVIRK